METAPEENPLATPLCAYDLLVESESAHSRWHDLLLRLSGHPCFFALMIGVGVLYTAVLIGNLDGPSYLSIHVAAGLDVLFFIAVTAVFVIVSSRFRVPLLQRMVSQFEWLYLLGNVSVAAAATAWATSLSMRPMSIALMVYVWTTNNLLILCFDAAPSLPTRLRMFVALVLAFNVGGMMGMCFFNVGQIDSYLWCLRSDSFPSTSDPMNPYALARVCWESRSLSFSAMGTIALFQIKYAVRAAWYARQSRIAVTTLANTGTIYGQCRSGADAESSDPTAATVATQCCAVLYQDCQLRLVEACESDPLGSAPVDPEPVPPDRSARISADRSKDPQLVVGLVPSSQDLELPLSRHAAVSLSDRDLCNPTPTHGFSADSGPIPKALNHLHRTRDLSLHLELRRSAALWFELSIIPLTSDASLALGLHLAPSSRLAGLVGRQVQFRSMLLRITSCCNPDLGQQLQAAVSSLARSKLYCLFFMVRFLATVAWSLQATLADSGDSISLDGGFQTACVVVLVLMDLAFLIIESSRVDVTLCRELLYSFDFGWIAANALVYALTTTLASILAGDPQFATVPVIFDWRLHAVNTLAFTLNMAWVTLLDAMPGLPWVIKRLCLSLWILNTIRMVTLHYCLRPLCPAISLCWLRGRSCLHLQTVAISCLAVCSFYLCKCAVRSWRWPSRCHLIRCPLQYPLESMTYSTRRTGIGAIHAFPR
jgi:hypothetical protein